MQVPKTGFSVSATKKVKFSSGNLQATTTDLGEHWIWKFAENQWDCVGNTAANTSIKGNKTVSENGTVDLFGWSTASTYLGIHNSINSNTYSGNFVDWGSHPDVIDAIGSGWRTLSKEEWNYLLNTRTVNGGSGIGYSYTVAQEVNGVLGAVIYPDDYTGSSYNGIDWSSFEDAGCIFLPAAGERTQGTTIEKLNQKGLYWASNSGIREFNSYGSPSGWFSAYVGNSVRLVRNIE